MNDPIIDAEEASRILNSALFQGAFRDVREQFIAEWVNAPLRDVEGQTYLLMLVKALDKVKATLEHRINTGKLEKVKIERKEKDSLFQRALSRVA